jgi:hypothetical protein
MGPVRAFGEFSCSLGKKGIKIAHINVNVLLSKLAQGWYSRAVEGSI